MQIEREIERSIGECAIAEIGRSGLLSEFDRWCGQMSESRIADRRERYSGHSAHHGRPLALMAFPHMRVEFRRISRPVRIDSGRQGKGPHESGLLHALYRRESRYIARRRCWGVLLHRQLCVVRLASTSDNRDLTIIIRPPPVPVAVGERNATALDSWTSPGFMDTQRARFEAFSNASGLTPPRWLWRRVRL